MVSTMENGARASICAWVRTEYDPGRFSMLLGKMLVLLTTTSDVLWVGAAFWAAAQVANSDKTAVATKV